MSIKKFLPLILFGITVVFLAGSIKSTAENYAVNPPFYHQNKTWVDSVLKTMTLREKIGQLFMVAAYSNRDSNETIHIDSLVKKYHVGGLIFFQGAPYRQVNLTNHYQNESKIPLLIAMDAEWGLNMRLDSTIKYPYQMTLGAIQNDSLIYKMGQQIAKQCKRIGVNVNFAPDIDLNTTSENPVINARSFGDNKHNVAKKGLAYAKGMQSEGILAVGKHFPGHGDTKKDSHKTLPTVHAPISHLDTFELYPFKQFARNGIGGIMTAHLFVPALDTTFNRAADLSPKIVDTLLKSQIGFKGIAFTDALDMKGVSAYYPSGQISLKAFMAGNDILLFPNDIAAAYDTLLAAVDSGLITTQQINQRCRKILEVKAWSGLKHWKDIDTSNLYQDLNKPKYQELNKKLFYNSLTLLYNKKHLLPLHSYDFAGKKVATLAIGSDSLTTFQKMINNYIKTDTFYTPEITLKNEAQLLDTLRQYNLVIISINKSTRSPLSRFKISDEEKRFCKLMELGTNTKIILTFFTNAYAMIDMPAVYGAEAVLEAYQNNYYTNRAAAQALFGAIPVTGRLPVHISDTLLEGSGVDLKKVKDILSYGLPQDVGINPNNLNGIDSIATEGIRAKAFPGCRILVAKNGEVIYNKAFGYFTYDSTRHVKQKDIYDLASVTKIAATTPSLIKLDGEGKFSLNSKMKKYLPKLLKNSPDANLKVRDVMAHQARLRPWIPFFKETLIKGNKLNPKIYQDSASPEFPTQVAKNLFIKKGYNKKIYQEIVHEPLRKKKEYKYSDLGFYLFKKVIQKETKTPMQDYVQEAFYKPLGMWHTTYNPLGKFPVEEIAPTENDTVFRHQLIRGYVQDQGAAMLGGVSGHAGLFSDADDLAILMQMYLQNGEYDGKRYLDSAVLAEYTKCQFCNTKTHNRRGAGFDKPERDGKGGPTCNCVSFKSFGHQGYTGTEVWTDPDKKVVYIFLSNRVYPNANNWKYLKMNIRTRIMKVIYDAIDKSEKIKNPNLKQKK